VNCFQIREWPVKNSLKGISTVIKPAIIKTCCGINQVNFVDEISRLHQRSMRRNSVSGDSGHSSRTVLCLKANIKEMIQFSAAGRINPYAELDSFTSKKFINIT